METGIIVALFTGAVTLVGYLFNRRGTREASAQANRANELKEREIDWERRGDIIADLTTELDRLRAIKRSVQQSCSAAMSNNIETISMLQTVLRDETAREIAAQTIKEARQHDDTHDRGL